jgi:hypothetical protein
VTTGTLLTITVFTILSTSTATLAQPGDPTNPDNQVPIGGIEILIVSGSIYGVKKILERRKQMKNRDAEENE